MQNIKRKLLYINHSNHKWNWIWSS